MANSKNDSKKQKQDLVITPGGPRPANFVHPVGPNQVVDVDREGNAFVTFRSTESPKTKFRSSNMPNNLVLTPGGFRHPSLVHQVESGQALYAEAGRMRILDLSSKAFLELPEVAIGPEEIPALGSGWIVYSYWNNGTGNSISSFSTAWKVPPTPTTQKNQIIFLFNGIQNYGENFGILQPVLQWGSSAAGGGPYWSIASWYVTSKGQAFHTPLVKVGIGQTLLGLMTLSGKSGTRFNYNSEFRGIPGTSLPVQNIAELLWCNETLEAYTLTQCSDYPSTDHTAFQEINIQTGSVFPTLKWTPVNAVTDCGQHVVVISDSATSGEVDIHYR